MKLPGKSYYREMFSTVDLLVLTNLDQLLVILKKRPYLPVADIINIASPQ
jgi:hypothetical protein